MAWVNPKIFLATPTGKGVPKQNCVSGGPALRDVVITKHRHTMYLSSWKDLLVTPRSGGTSIGLSPSTCILRFIHLLIHSDKY